MGELCQNTVEESEGNTVEFTIDDYFGQQSPSQPTTGGFHQLMSFTSEIGYPMIGSGNKEWLEDVFPGFPVDKLLSGKSHDNSLQAHFLIDAALCKYLMEDVLSNDELEQVLDEIEKTKEGRHGASYKHIHVWHGTKITGQTGLRTTSWNDPKSLD